jgi:predicted nucleic acid-binding protein
LVEETAPAERNVSAVSYLELLYGCRNSSELIFLRKSLSERFAETIPVTESISHLAIRFMEKYALSKRPGTNDVLIAATAVERKEVLVTGNSKHFDFVPGLELRILRT